MYKFVNINGKPNTYMYICIYIKMFSKCNTNIR